ncbi:MAG: amidase, partial [Comamonadaceae bacterium]
MEKCWTCRSSNVPGARSRRASQTAPQPASDPEKLQRTRTQRGESHPGRRRYRTAGRRGDTAAVIAAIRIAGARRARGPAGDDQQRSGDGGRQANARHARPSGHLRRLVPRLRRPERCMTQWLEQDMVGIANALRDGDVSAEAITTICLERMERLGTAFNAVVLIESEKALSAAREADVARAQGKPLGALHGVPLAHKDIFHRAGRICAGGSKICADHVPTDTATVLQRLDAAGALDLGSLHMAEFAFSPTGYNAHYGHGRNPWRPTHVPGGSSSGSGISVAARMVFGSLGTDTGGSVRQPAAMCGITGLKPTHRRVSTAGTMPLSRSLDCIGPLAQSARDCARLLTIIAGADARDGAAAERPVPDYEARLGESVRGLRIARPRGFYDELLQPEVRTVLEESLRVLR